MPNAGMRLRILYALPTLLASCSFLFTEVSPPVATDSAVVDADYDAPDAPHQSTDAGGSSSCLPLGQFSHDFSGSNLTGWTSTGGVSFEASSVRLVPADGGTTITTTDCIQLPRNGSSLAIQVETLPSIVNMDASFRIHEVNRGTDVELRFEQRAGNRTVYAEVVGTGPQNFKTLSGTAPMAWTLQNCTASLDPCAADGLHASCR